MFAGQGEAIKRNTQRVEQQATEAFADNCVSKARLESHRMPASSIVPSAECISHAWSELGGEPLQALTHEACIEASGEKSNGAMGRVQNTRGGGSQAELPSLVPGLDASRHASKPVSQRQAKPGWSRLLTCACSNADHLQSHDQTHV